MLRMFALIMPEPVCVCVRSRAVNPAYIPGPDINTVLESCGVRLAVMLEESSLCSMLLMKGAGREGGWKRGKEGGREQTCTWSAGSTLVFGCTGSVFLPGWGKKGKGKGVCVCRYHNQTFSSDLSSAGFMRG